MRARAAFLLLSLVACRDSEPENKAPSSNRSAVSVEATKSSAVGTIRGRVLLDGVAPVAPPILLGATDGCGSLRAAAPAEKLVVNEGGIANVLVRVKSGLPPDARWDVPAEPVVLDQQGCVFVPHVVALRVGQALNVRNSDPLVHNVNVRPARQRNDASNRSLAPGSTDLRLVFDAPEAAIPLRCDIHPWMQAYVHIVEHPFFAVTRADGSFEIPGLSPGTYEIELVHEWLGKHAFEARLDDSSGVEARLTLSLP
jgi:plastocyanin